MLIHFTGCIKGIEQYAELTSTPLAMYKAASFGRCRACVSMTSGPEKNATTSAPANQQKLSSMQQHNAMGSIQPNRFLLLPAPT